MKPRSLRNQQGFTLIEIAIVLVIIGILTVGVLQGQEVIENSRTKSIVADMKSMQVAYNSYLDRYQQIPGDESALTMTNRGWAGAAGSAAPNGQLTIAPGTIFTTGAAEGASFWRAVRAAGYVSGDPTAAYLIGLPRHKGGGLLAVAGGATTVFGMTGSAFVCASGLTGKQAAAIDVQIDGPASTTAGVFGNNTGNLRADVAATVGLVAPGGANYSETAAATWIACMKMA